MKDRTLSFLQSLYDPEQCGFKFHPQGNVTLLSTCFGVQSVYLVDRMDIVESEKTGSFISQQQRDDGIFVDRNFCRNQLSGLQSTEYIEWQFTFFSLIALDMLGVQPKNELHFLKVFQEKDYIVQWLDSLNWDDFWYCSNEIMFLLFFFTHSQLGAGDSYACDTAIAQIFEYLNKSQEETTGYWGTEVRTRPLNGMFGAAHIYLFYRFFKREIQYEEQVVLSTLALQLPDGLYSPGGGGACEDYDGVEILVRMLNSCPPLESNIQKSLIQTYQKIIKAGGRFGGFPYRLPENNYIAYAKRKINQFLGRTTYRYSGWELMECDMYSPDIWGTYFRLMTIALIEISLELPKSFSYNSYPLPGWGYLVDPH